MTPYGGAKLQPDYTAATWKNLTTADGRIVGLPQNANPMIFFYRKDLFEKAGISSPPQTWSEFVTDAEKVKGSTGAALTSLDPGDPGLAIGLLQQAGADSFAYDGKKTVKIDLTNAKAKSVAAFLTKLVRSKAVEVAPALTTDWYQSVANDRYAGWLQAAAGQNNLINTLPQQAGDWVAAAAPRSTTNGPNGSIGGSATVILSGSQHKIAAYELAKFLFNDPSIVAEGSSKAFPAVKSVLDSDAFAQATSPFFGGQKANELYATQWKDVRPSTGSLPFMAYVTSTFADTVGTAMTNGSDLESAFAQWQGQLVSYAKQQGFTVEK